MHNDSHILICHKSRNRDLKATMSVIGLRDEHHHGHDQGTETSLSQESDVREAEGRVDDVEGGEPSRAAADVTGVSSSMGGVKMRAIRNDRRRYFVRGLVVVLAIVAVSVLAAVFVPRKQAASETIAPSSVPTFTPTQSPTSMELREVMEALRKIADSDSLEDTSSPQYHAAVWLARDFVSGGRSYEVTVEDTKFVQRYALAVLYYAMAGHSFMFCGLDASQKCDEFSWLAESDECTWRGMRCSNETHIDRISFSTSKSLR
jgi:hypothetical protein